MTRTPTPNLTRVEKVRLQQFEGRTLSGLSDSDFSLYEKAESKKLAYMTIKSWGDDPIIHVRQLELEKIGV